MKTLIFAFAGVFVILLAVVFIFNNTASHRGGVYEMYGLEGLTTKAMVETLDRQTLDKAVIGAAILEQELVIHHAEGEDRFAIEDNLFYLSFAPYIATTHPCHNHNLVTCQGELAGETVYVVIVASDGTTLFDQDVTLYDNGFKGIWLPASIEATMTIDYDNLSVTTPITTYQDSGTCLTEALKLS